MDNRHIASVIVSPDSYRKQDSTVMSSLFTRPDNSSSNVLQGVDQKYVASVFVADTTSAYEPPLNRPPIEHQYEKIKEKDTVPEKGKTSKVRKPKKDKTQKQAKERHRVLRVRTLVISVVISLIIGVLFAVFVFLAIQYFNDNKGLSLGDVTIGSTSEPPSSTIRPTTEGTLSTS